MDEDFYTKLLDGTCMVYVTVETLQPLREHFTDCDDVVYTGFSKGFFGLKH